MSTENLIESSCTSFPITILFKEQGSVFVRLDASLAAMLFASDAQKSETLMCVSFQMYSIKWKDIILWFVFAL